MYSLNSIKRYLADKFVISCDDNEFDTNALIDGIISNAKLLSNNKLEYDNLLEIFKKRLDVFYNGKNAISKVLNSNGFINHNNDMSILKFISNKSYQLNVKTNIREISTIFTSLFMHEEEDKIYNGLEITKKTNNTDIVLGSSLNNIVNEVYSLIMHYNRFPNLKVTPNDIINKDMRENIKNDPKINNKNKYIKMFNLVRILLIASENKPNINYNKLIKENKSIVNHKIYNSCGDKVVVNELLYAGKYGKAAKEYYENFNKIVNYNGAFECLLDSYDMALEDLIKNNKIDKDIVKRIISIVYEYYGSRYILLEKTNAFSSDQLIMYKYKFKKAIDELCNEYGITLTPMEKSMKKSDEEAIEKVNYTRNNYYRLYEVKENFEVQDKVSDLTKKRVKKLLKQYDLK